MFGGVLGLAFGSTSRRIALLSALGAAIVLAVLIGGIATAPTERPENCADCNEFFGGRWFNGLIFLVAAFNVLLWIVAVAIGGWVRRRVRPAQ